MLKINCKQILKSFKGEPLKTDTGELTFGEAMAVVLSGQSSNPTLAWVLGKKFATEDSISLKAEEVVFLKKEVADNKHWTAVVLGQIMEILDGEAPVVPEAKIV